MIGEENGWRRYGIDGGGSGKHVDIRAMPNEPRGSWGTGGVHHVAWRVPDDAGQVGEIEPQTALCEVGDRLGDEGLLRRFEASVE